MSVKESKQSIQGIVFTDSADAHRHGKGGIWYHWKDGSEKQFPQDVTEVMIVMPVDWGEPGIANKGISCGWSVSYRNCNGARWVLSGTQDRPTLSPSLHWVGVWHGWLKDGFLQSC